MPPDHPVPPPAAPLTIISPQAATFSSFDGHCRLASGTIEVAAKALKNALDGGATGPLLLIDDSTGRTVDIDTRGDSAEVIARLASHPLVVAMADAQAAAASASASAAAAATAAAGQVAGTEANRPRGRGRPKLGVVAREVTLLPRHWEWLATQPGGASIALRRLVEEARRSSKEKARIRQAREAAYHFMQTVAGDLLGFEEAARALFADDRAAFLNQIASWPNDVRDHALRLGFDG